MGGVCGAGVIAHRMRNQLVTERRRLKAGKAWRARISGGEMRISGGEMSSSIMAPPHLGPSPARHHVSDSAVTISVHGAGTSSAQGCGASGVSHQDDKKKRGWFGGKQAGGQPGETAPPSDNPFTSAASGSTELAGQPPPGSNPFFAGGIR